VDDDAEPDPTFLRHMFSPYGLYVAGTLRRRPGFSSYALISLGKAALQRVLEQPRPPQLADFELVVLDTAKAYQSKGRFPQTYERHAEKAQHEYSLLLRGRDTMWQLDPGYSEEQERAAIVIQAHARRYTATNHFKTLTAVQAATTQAANHSPEVETTVAAEEGQPPGPSRSRSGTPPPRRTQGTGSAATLAL
jgi:hypothetical protein